MNSEADWLAPEPEVVHFRNSEATLLNPEDELFHYRQSYATLLNSDDELVLYQFRSSEISLELSDETNASRTAIQHDKTLLGTSDELRHFIFEPSSAQNRNGTEDNNVRNRDDVENQNVQNDDYPDGGLEAMIVVAGAFGSVMASVGYVNCAYANS
jgi:hypothetical protein